MTFEQWDMVASISLCVMVSFATFLITSLYYMSVIDRLNKLKLQEIKRHVKHE